MANVSSNSTDFSTPERFYHQYMFYHALTIQLVICVFGILSNGLFGVTFIRYPNLQTPFNTLAFALTVNDFFASLIAMPIVHALGHYQHTTKSLKTPLCDFNIFNINLFKWNAVLLMTEMAILRARCVFASRTYRLKKSKINALILCNILVSLAFSAYKSISKSNICHRISEQSNGRRYDMVTNITVFLSLYLVLVIAYAILAIVTHRRAAAIARRDRSSNRFEIATLRACAITVVCHIVFHLPYLFYTLALHFGISDDHSYYANAYVTSYFGVNNVINSFVLIATSTQYRKHIMLLLRRRQPAKSYPVIK